MIWFSLLQQELLELLPIVLRRPHLLVPVLLYQNTYNVRSLLGDGFIVNHMEVLNHMDFLTHLHNCHDQLHLEQHQVLSRFH